MKIREVVNNMINQEIDSILNTKNLRNYIDFECNLVTNLHDSVDCIIEYGVKEKLYQRYHNRENIRNVIISDILNNFIDNEGLINQLITNYTLKFRKLLVSRIEKIESNTRFNINIKCTDSGTEVVCGYENKKVKLLSTNEINVFDNFVKFINDVQFRQYLITYVINSETEKHFIVSYSGLDLICNYIESNY